MLDARRQQLLTNKLRAILTWVPPVIVATVGPHDPSVFAEFDNRRRVVIGDCQAFLAGLSEDQVDTLLDDDGADDTGLRQRWSELRRADVNWLNKPPPWCLTSAPMGPNRAI